MKLLRWFALQFGALVGSFTFAKTPPSQRFALWRATIIRARACRAFARGFWRGSAVAYWTGRVYAIALSWDQIEVTGSQERQEEFARATKQVREGQRRFSDMIGR